MNTKEAVKQVKVWRKQALRVVLVTGVFDILHIEHFRFFKKAKRAGDVLLVGVESDVRVKQIKGEERPVNSEKDRVEQLLSLKSVDAAFVLPEKFNSQDDWEALMNQIRPNVYAVSSHTSYLENKKKIAEKFGIDFEIVHEFNPMISTSKIHAKLAAEI